MHRMYGIPREAWMPVEVMYRMYGISREAGAGSGYVQDVRYFTGGRSR